ncbi:MAG: class I SAM-dependent methyltransferase [Fimbriimonadaceae bacterium]|nr:class I SAM-dependent methyltransferase [Fimbriimonadaceae bacterium]
MSQKPADPRSQFGAVAENYLTSKAHNKPDELARIVARVQPYGKILDIGTGAGHTAYAFAPFVEQVTAIDITQQMLDIVAREAGAKGLQNIDTCLASAEKLPFESGSMDGVVCRLCAHHFESVADFMSEVNRVLKQGGFFVLIDTIGPEDEATQREVDAIEALRDPSHAHDLSVTEWNQHLASVGFVTEWIDVTRKQLDLEDWLERMNVPDEHRVTLRGQILDSAGTLRDYLNPQTEPKTAFDLWEITFLARKPATTL